MMELVRSVSTLSELILEAIERYSSCPCIEEMTYQDLGRIVDEYRVAWMNAGILPGDRVVLQLSDPTKMIVAMLAALACELIPVFMHQHLADTFITESGAILNAKQYLGDKSISLIGVGGTENSEWATPQENEALIACTSGTTAKPKLVVHSHSSILSNIQGILDYISLNTDDVVLIIRPPSYLSVITGEVLVAIACGSHIKVLRHVISSSSLVENIAKMRATFIVSVASLFYFSLPIIRQKTDTLLTLRYLLFVGEGATYKLLDELQTILPNTEILHCYGLTETGPRLTYCSAKKHPLEPFCVGEPLQGVQFQIMDYNNLVLEDNQEGIVSVASPSMMLGYVGEPKPSGKWLITNDWGFMNSAGLLFIKGRADHIIVRGGLKIHPVTIENVMTQYPNVLRAAVFGNIQDTYRIAVIGLVMAKDEMSLDVDALLNYCHKQLPSQMWPNKIYQINELPLTEGGKLDRSKLNQKYIEALTIVKGE